MNEPGARLRRPQNMSGSDSRGSEPLCCLGALGISVRARGHSAPSPGDRQAISRCAFAPLAPRTRARSGPQIRAPAPSSLISETGGHEAGHQRQRDPDAKHHQTKICEPLSAKRFGRSSLKPQNRLDAPGKQKSRRHQTRQFAVQRLMSQLNENVDTRRRHDLFNAEARLSLSLCNLSARICVADPRDGPTTHPLALAVLNRMQSPNRVVMLQGATRLAAGRG